MASQKQIAVYVGRFNPPHNGHVKVIREMLNDFGENNSIVLIGSCTESNTLNNIFSYQQRREMLREMFYGLYIAGVPDFPNNNLAWFSYIKDLIRLKTNGIDKDIVFYGGSEADTFYAVDGGFKTKVITRYDKVKISSSEIKDKLIREESIFEMVPQEIEGTIINGFNDFWHNRYKKTK